MRTYKESEKSKKTVSSMIENKKEEPVKGKKKNKPEGIDDLWPTLLLMQLS